MENIVLIFFLCMMVLLFYYLYTIQSKKHTKIVSKLINRYGLTIPELTGYNCTYAGGHPDYNLEAKSVVVGAKNGNLIFFAGILLDYRDEDLSPKGTLSYVNVNGVKYLFCIPISNITDIQYVDATTSSIKVGIGTSVMSILT